MAPEVLRNKVQRDKGTLVDVYSFGIIMHEVFFEKMPYEEERYDSIIGLGTDVVSGKRPFIQDREYSEKESEYLDLMQRCWDGVAENRPTFDEIFTIMLDVQNK
jgi:serine/threonine protein kinase